MPSARKAAALSNATDDAIEFGRRGRMAIFAGFVLLVFAGIAALVVAGSSDKAAQAATHFRQVREGQVLLFSALQDAETGQRGYLLTDDPSYLEPFTLAEERLPVLKTSLEQLVTGEPEQRRAVDGLLADVDRKMEELRRTIVREKAGDQAGALAIVRTNQGNAIMIRMRVESRAFDQAEGRIFDRSREAVDLQRAVLKGMIDAALGIAGLLGLVVWVEMRRTVAELGRRNAALVAEAAERQRAESQLRQAQKMEALGQLTGGIAHDFNNMLAIVIGNLDMVIRRMTGGDERLRTMAENALVGANRAAALTSRLLAFSRQAPLDPRPTDVNRCVAGMSELLRGVLGSTIAIETVLAGGLWSAMVDCPQLESALLNLAVNARDAMPQGGRLTLETANAYLDEGYAALHEEVTAGQYVMISVTDSGSGMPAGVIDRAFDPFFTTKKPGEGTGLGLSQVHGFLKQSRGHIKLYSEAGVGTTVKLYLPRDESGVPASTETTLASAAHQAEGFTVLIVEDDPSVRGFAVSAAQELGHVVVEADSAAVALERLRENADIAVLLTDVVMPGVNGRQLADQALAERPYLPVVYMTGYTRNAIVHNGMLDRGTRLLTKPFTLADLDRELRAAVATISGPRG